MARRTTWLAIVLLAGTALAQTSVPAGPASISGVVRNGAGQPQMGVAVQLSAGALGSTTTVFTDAAGRYFARNLAAGTYTIRVDAPAYLSVVRENLALKSGTQLVVNLTLNTLFEAVKLLPPRRTSPSDDDDWKWTLRSAGNRPVLRMVGVSSSKDPQPPPLQARVAFLAGSEAQGFGRSSDLTTTFDVQTSLFTSGTLSFNGNVGRTIGTAAPATMLRAAYSHEIGGVARPEIAVTVRRFAAPDFVQHGAALQALAVSLNDHAQLGEFLEISYGGEFQSIEFGTHANAFRPFGAADFHLGPNTVVEYRYATAVPTTRAMKGYDSMPADLSESGPRLSLSRGLPQIERARHQEVSVSRKFGDTRVQVAGYNDQVRNTALLGVGDAMFDGGTDLLPDVYSSTFTYNGGAVDTRGLRVVLERQLAAALTATLDYAYGGSLDFAQDGESIASFHMHPRQAVAGKVSGTMPVTKTKWIASYRWMNGRGLTPVDMFNTSAGQTDPYLSFFIRQPIPATSFIPAKMEALIDVRNLLSQGYVPVTAQDGHTLYLVQSARAVRGGLAFVF